MLSSLSPQMLKVVGSLLIMLGLFYLFRMWEALFKGKVTYWAGWLPVTLISPWTCLMPANPKTLVKAKEAMWVHIVMAPLFLLSAALCIGAGADFWDLPGTDTLNAVFGRSGPRSIIFSKEHGYSFPIIGRSVTAFGKALANGQMGVSKDKQLVDENHGSLNDAMR